MFRTLEARTITTDTLPSALPEVRIRLNRPMAIRKGDTLEYDVQQYQPRVAESLEQLLGRMPGFQVDAGGIIRFNGRQISRIKIDGDDLSAGDYRYLSRIIKAGMLRKIQLLQHDQPNRLLQEILPGEELAINLQIQAGSGRRPHGNVAAGLTQGQLRGSVELAGLDPRMRQLLMVSHSPGVDPGMVSVGGAATVESGNEHERPYQSWTTNPDLLNEPMLLPEQYLQMVRQLGRWTTSFKTDSFTRVRHTLDVSQKTTAQDETQQRHWWWEIEGINNMVTAISRLGVRREVIDRIEIENDKGKSHTERWLIQMQTGTTSRMYQEQEIQHGWRDIQLKQDRKKTLFDVSRTSTRKTGGMVVLHQQKFSRDAHAIKAFQPEDQMIWTGNHHGWMAYDQWTTLVQRRNTLIQAGIKNVWYNLTAGSYHEEARLRVFKTYPFFQWQQRRGKKITQEFRFASGGVGLRPQGQGTQWMPTGKLGWQTEWKPRPIHGLRFGVDMSRILEDPSAWHPGRVLHANGQSDAGTSQLVMTSNGNLHAGWSSMNLYRGLVWQVQAQLGMSGGERSTELIQQLYRDSVQTYALGTRREFRVQGSADHYIHPLKIRTAFGLGYHVSDMTQRVQGTLLPTRIDQMNIRMHLQTQWKGWYNMTWLTVWNAMWTKLSGDIGLYNASHQHELQVILKPMRQGWLEFQCRELGNHRGRSLYLIDLKAYQPLSKQVDLSLQVNNALNNHTMQQWQQGISGMMVRTIALPGRRLTVELLFRF